MGRMNIGVGSRKGIAKPDKKYSNGDSTRLTKFIHELEGDS